MLWVKRIFVAVMAALLVLCGSVYGQQSQNDTAVVLYRGIEFSYVPQAFGAMLASYDEGTLYQTDAPYFANTAPHISFKFMRPDPARPDTNWVGELRVYRIDDLENYGEPSYRDVVKQFQNLDITNLEAYVTVGTDHNIASLPFMPVVNALQVLRLHPGTFDTNAVSGIEYYTYYSQAPEPLFEGQILYTYQGITVDGLYYLSFSMPINTGILQTTIAPDMDWDAFAAQYTPYLQDTFAALKSADPGSYTPSLSVFHSFIQSISIQG